MSSSSEYYDSDSTETSEEGGVSPFSEEEMNDLLLRAYRHAQEHGFDGVPFDGPPGFDYERAIQFIAATLRRQMVSQIVDSGETIGIILDAHVSDSAGVNFLLHLKFRGECKFLEIVERKNRSGQELYRAILARLEKYGISEDFLKENLVVIQYEGDSVLDDVARLFVSEIHSRIVVQPFLHHHMGRALMHTLRDQMASLVSKLIDSAKKNPPKEFAEKLKQITDPHFVDHETWFSETLPLAMKYAHDNGIGKNTEMGVFIELLGILRKTREDMRDKAARPFNDNLCWDECKKELEVFSRSGSADEKELKSEMAMKIVTAINPRFNWKLGSSFE